jgi:hypothetical protein
MLAMDSVKRMTLSPVATRVSMAKPLFVKLRSRGQCGNSSYAGTDSQWIPLFARGGVSDFWWTSR